MKRAGFDIPFHPVYQKLHWWTRLLLRFVKTRVTVYCDPEFEVWQHWKKLDGIDYLMDEFIKNKWD